jgi:hypothetical protein
MSRDRMMRAKAALDGNLPEVKAEEVFLLSLPDVSQHQGHPAEGIVSTRNNSF